MSLKILLLIAFAERVAAHGIMTIPVPRGGVQRQGIKLQPFTDARSVSNRGCGGIENQDTGVVPPSIGQPNALNVYRAGGNIQVQWKLTIPHDADVQDSGVRLALYYDSGDSFQCNIMAGGLEGDSGFDVTVDGVTGPRVLSAGPPGATPNQLVSTIITLPANKTCDYCVLQWVWAARSDGGFYVDCADIAITRDGNTPNYAALPTEAGNELPVNQPRVNSGGCTAASNGGSIAAVVVVILLLCVCGGLYYFYKKKADRPASATEKYAAAAPPPAPGGGGGGGLPAGWTAAVDPSSGATYYTNSATGETTWTRPAGGPAPPRPSGFGGLPAGWTSAVDPSSGATYYTNSATGQTQWTRP